MDRDYKAMGAKGGNSTKERHGIEFYSKIAKGELKKEKVIKPTQVAQVTHGCPRASSCLRCPVLFGGNFQVVEDTTKMMDKPKGCNI